MRIVFDPKRPQTADDQHALSYEVLATLGTFYPDRAPYDPNCPLGEIYA